MVNRPFWLKKISEAWRHRSVLWMSGVRRVGKTSLCQSIPDIEYLDCELPRVRQQLEDPQSFFDARRKKKIVFDEIHRIENPSELLKIGADHYPDIKIIATGSSTLGASAKFKDTLSGRKTELWITPLLSEEADLFGISDIKHRFLYGGLPPFFITRQIPEKDFQEWIDAFWAKDIQELFRLEKRYSFQKFLELLLAQSGSIFDATRFAKSCEASRSTLSNYLAVLESTFVVHVIKPFNTHKPTEIISAPKVFGFDTGFICHARGWSSLRKEDLGTLWEHVVLNELQGRLQTRLIHYWRDKSNHEIDFIYLKKRNDSPTTIECKWSYKQFEPIALKVFRQQYPTGSNFVVCQDVDRSFQKKYDGLPVTFVNLKTLLESL